MKRFLTLMLICACFSLAAQQDTTAIKNREVRLALKWSPVHLLGQFQTFQIAMEHRLTKDMSIQYEAGPVINLKGFHDTKISRKRGAKIKLEIRQYYQRTRLWNFYYAGQVYYNYVNYKRGKTYRVNPQNSYSDGYYQFIKHDMEYREPGVTIKAGALFHYYRFCIDFHVGISAQFITYNESNSPLPSTYELIENDNRDFELFPDLSEGEESRNSIRPTVGIRLGYIIR